ncbi:MAG TPA: hypothetical protein VFY16_14245 [Gemmatimonadaceae bacterium]|nr:hypothetical protein [Gemmatimonadaceae bacterium]
MPDIARQLREHALAVAAPDLDVAPAPGHTHVWGVLMETGYPEGVATLVCLADGATSLYFSNGGGVIGAGEHQRVRDAATRFIAMADACVAELEPTTTHPFPKAGRVRFYARTFHGLRTAEASEDELGAQPHPLSPVFLAGHAVVSAIRESGAGK